MFIGFSIIHHLIWGTPIYESREAAERKFVSADAGGYQAGRMIFGVFHEKIMGENMVINGGNMVMS